MNVVINLIKTKTLIYMDEIKEIILEDGNRFIGRFENGKRNGFGIKIYKNGARYEGFYVNDVRHGKGVKITANNDKKEVEYNNGIKI